MSYRASWIRISAARHEGLRYRLGKDRFLVSEYVVKIGLSVIGFAKAGGLERGGGVERGPMKMGIDGGLFNFLVSKNSRSSYNRGISI